MAEVLKTYQKIYSKNKSSVTKWLSDMNHAESDSGYPKDTTNTLKTISHTRHNVLSINSSKKSACA